MEEGTEVSIYFKHTVEKDFSMLAPHLQGSDSIIYTVQYRVIIG